MGMIGIILFLVVLVGAILYVRLKQGCFFKPRLGVNFPEELVPYIKEYPLKYFVARRARIVPFLKRYREAKEREKNFFSSKRFLDEEKEKLMRVKKNRR